MTALRLGLLQYGVGRPASVAEFARRLDALVAEAAGAGAELLVLPEYACVEIASAFNGHADVDSELAAVTAQTDALLDAMRGAATRHGVWLLPGTLPVRDGDRLLNRAPLIAADGRMGFQDKRVMTRFEAELWRVSPGVGWNGPTAQRSGAPCARAPGASASNGADKAARRVNVMVRPPNGCTPRRRGRRTWRSAGG